MYVISGALDALGCSSQFTMQYWIVHKCKVDVPAMYRPNGRYRYTFGFVRVHLPFGM